MATGSRGPVCDVGRELGQLGALERVGALCGALAWRSDVMLLIKALLDTPFWRAKLFSVVPDCRS